MRGLKSETISTEVNIASLIVFSHDANHLTEAQTRQAFLNTLTVDVVNILTALKVRLNLSLCCEMGLYLCVQDTQDRTRKRIKDDLKESSNAYNEYAENILPKLKRTYLRKCQEVEDHKAAAAAQTHTHRPEHSYQQPYPPEQYNAPLTNSRSNPSLPTKPVVTSPHPLRPLDRRPSGSMPSTRSRSPSTNTAFSDLASHGKFSIIIWLKWSAQSTWYRQGQI